MSNKHNELKSNRLVMGNVEFKTLWDTIKYNHNLSIKIIESGDVKSLEDRLIKLELEGYTLILGTYDLINEDYSYMNKPRMNYLDNKIKITTINTDSMGGDFTFNFNINNEIYEGKGYWSRFDGYWYCMKWIDLLKLVGEFKKVNLT